MGILKRVAACMVVAVAFGTVSPAGVAAADGRNCFQHKLSEHKFVEKMNGARGVAGVGRLELDKHLSRVARRHSWEMKDRRTLYHTPSATLRYRVTRWNMLGENVGVGGNVLELHRAFMASPAHRDNVLRDAYQHVGVGVHKSDNYLWVTIVFEARRDPGTRLRMCR